MTSSSSRHVSRVNRGWDYKGRHSGIFENYKDLSFSAIIAFLEQHFYGILINEDSNDSLLFDTFCIIWLRQEKNYLKREKKGTALFVIMQLFISRN